jgi:hypothetical protein
VARPHKLPRNHSAGLPLEPVAEYRNIESTQTGIGRDAPIREDQLLDAERPALAVRQNATIASTAGHNGIRTCAL